MLSSEEKSVTKAGGFKIFFQHKIQKQTLKMSDIPGMCIYGRGVMQ